MTTSEPGGARVPAAPERLAEAERRIRAALRWTDCHHRRYVELSPGATPGPWARRRPGASYLDAAAPADEHPAFVRSGRVEVIRSAVWEGTGGEFVRARTDRDLDWIAALSPVVAAPLAAWLRETAEYVAAVQCSPPAGAVALARALLGDLPDTPETKA